MRYYLEFSQNMSILEMRNEQRKNEHCATRTFQINMPNSTEQFCEFPSSSNRLPRGGDSN